MAEITDAMRQAVLDEQCEQLGHVWDLTDAIGATDETNPNDPRGVPMTVLRAKDANQMPHIKCQRCNHVWIIIDEEGTDYRDAVAKVRARFAAARPHGDIFRPRPRHGIEKSWREPVRRGKPGRSPGKPGAGTNT